MEVQQLLACGVPFLTPWSTQAILEGVQVRAVWGLAARPAELKSRTGRRRAEGSGTVWEIQYSLVVKGKDLHWKSSSAAYLLDDTSVSPNLCPKTRTPQGWRKGMLRECTGNTAQCWVCWQHSNEVSNKELLTHLFSIAGGQRGSSF